MSTSSWDRAKAALDDLGATPDEIAAALERLGYRGYRLAAWDCPLARYLGERLGAMVAVEGTYASWFDPSQGRSVRLPLASPLRMFVERFDAGGYRELEEASG